MNINDNGWQLNSYSILKAGPEKTFFATLDKEGKLSLKDAVFKSVKTDLGEHLKKTANNTDAAAKSLVFVTLTKNKDGGNNVEVAAHKDAHKDVHEQVRAHFATNKKITVEGPNGKQTTHDIHSISLRTFTSEELQNALSQFFASIDENRKANKAHKESGRPEVNLVKNFPGVKSSKIKKTEKQENDGVKTIAIDHFARGIRAALDKDRESKAEARERRADEERDRIKDTEIKKSEKRISERKENQRKQDFELEKELSG